MVYKRVRVWISGRRLPAWNNDEFPRPPPPPPPPPRYVIWICLSFTVVSALGWKTMGENTMNICLVGCLLGCLLVLLKLILLETPYRLADLSRSLEILIRKRQLCTDALCATSLPLGTCSSKLAPSRSLNRPLDTDTEGARACKSKWRLTRTVKSNLVPRFSGGGERRDPENEVR